ncbi:MAG: Fur family transcriptional regulator [Coriobacteriia bacterium]
MSVTRNNLTGRAYGARRVSAARKAIAEIAAGLPGAFSVEGLWAKVTDVMPGVGLATVYRAVNAMLDTAYIAPVGASGGTALYAVCAGGAHHHHLVCTACGAVAGIACPVDGGLASTARSVGYTLTSHEITLYGVCRACSKATSEGVE